jgi:hypothetical protein
MGFLDIFRKSKETSEPQGDEERTEEQVLAIDEILEWVDKEFKEKMDRASSRASKIQKNVMDGFSRLRDSVGILEKASFEKQDRSYAAVNMVKDSFVKRTQSLINNVKRIQDNMNYTVLKDFHSNVSKIVNELKSLSPKQMVMISNYFKRECSDVINKMKWVEENVKSLGNFLDSDARVMRLVQDVNTSVEKQGEWLRELNSIEKRELELQNKLKDLKRVRIEKESGLKELLKSREWKELELIKKEVEGIRKEMSDIENRVNEEISSVKRPFKKLKHVLDAEMKTKSFPDNPFRELIIKDRENWLKGTLDSIRNSSESGEIVLKPRERERVLDLMKRLESEIPGLKERYRELANNINEKEGKSKTDAMKKRDSFEDVIKNSAERIVSLEKEARTIRNDKERIKGGLIEEKKKTERLILESGGRKVRIKIPGREASEKTAV